MKTWTIGRNPQCDVVIDRPEVADRHCLLRQTVGGFLLEDLGSSTGTFVDDQRITHPLPIGPENRIRLGASTPFAWPDGIDPQAIALAYGAAGSKIYRVGRFPDNDLVLDRDMISGRHAVLVVQRDRILLEDLGSTNGTAVGSINNRIESAEVEERDRVFFGSYSIIVTHLLAMTRKTKPPETVVEQPIQSSRKAEVARGGSKWLPLAAAGLLVACSIGVLIGLLNRQPQQTATNDPVPAEETEQPAPDATALLPPIAPPETADLLMTRGEDQQSGPVPISEAADALFKVIVTGDSKQIAFHIGTAWLVAADRLVTSGAVVSAIIEQDASGFSQVQVVQTSSGEVFDVATARLDSELAEAQQRYVEGRQKYGELQAEIKTLELRGDSEPRLSEARQESQAIIEAGLQSTAVRASFNVGWLELAAPVPEADPALLGNAGELVVGQILHMHAAPIRVENPAWDPAQASEPFGVEVRVEERIASTVEEVPDRWLMSMASPESQQNYVGSPILTQQGRVVAMFSRALADQPDADGRPSLLFETVSVQRVDGAGE
ncbi:FHA domain protein [Rosistilla oblonga]|uniref:FHA domain-containing protein n=1 Tax=Rosistilla oblonga TaxID=2527990 RepID=UPI001187FF32|nr:FHA domain-containing protein [Rosistilla oblonga]QDV11560.1 FHA domain protein [Rosistilla oblonga]